MHIGEIRNVAQQSSKFFPQYSNRVRMLCRILFLGLSVTRYFDDILFAAIIQITYYVLSALWDTARFNIAFSR